ncbi:hypothetical protein SETIT_2G389200v2 [Setaria italica]|uniref:Uncharacterized protein n=1 Tax=Setaria italica TaxID=4555 RepID=A0A368Q8D4_SETIT|nr:hypothetical protein SETIT_2G389200v2 [Setaria italica]
MPSPAATQRPSTCSASPARRSPSALTYHNAAVALCEPGVATEVACAGSVTEGSTSSLAFAGTGTLLAAAGHDGGGLEPWKLVEDESCGPSDTIRKERLGSLYESTHSSCK